jgi:hypothetical protein
MSKIAPTLQVFVATLYPDGPVQRKERDLMQKELLALLAVARAAKRMADFSIPPRDGQYRGLPQQEARRATFKALARLEKVSAPPRRSLPASTPASSANRGTTGTPTAACAEASSAAKLTAAAYREERDVMFTSTIKTYGPPQVCTGSGTLASDFRLVSDGFAKRCGICGKDVGTYDGQHIITHAWEPAPPQPTCQHPPEWRTPTGEAVSVCGVCLAILPTSPRSARETLLDMGGKMPTEAQQEANLLANGIAPPQPTERSEP